MICRSSRNVLTAHAPDAYPGLLVVRPGPEWAVQVIVPKDGQTIVGKGDEQVYGYDTVDGGHADAWQLGPGDRATLVRSGLPFSLVEWEIQRA
jgi:hypothetical protein